MKKNTLTIVLVLGVIALIAVWMVGRYNVMVTEEENVETAWGEVENQYQRRNDLIPQLVASTEGMAIHESQYMKDVIEARAKATQMTIDPSKMTEEQRRMDYDEHTFLQSVMDCQNRWTTKDLHRMATTYKLGTKEGEHPLDVLEFPH